MANVHRKTNASEIGTVLGCFSRHRQFSAILSMWKKSGLSLSSHPNRDGIKFYQEKKELLGLLGIKDQWDFLHQQSLKVYTQDHIDATLLSGWNYLFNNDFINNKLKVSTAYINSPQVTVSPATRKNIIDTLLVCTRDMDHHCNSISELEDFMHTFDLFGLKAFVEILKACRSQFQSLRSVANCSYGKNAERLYVGEFNKHTETGMHQPSVTSSKVASIPTKSQQNWFIEGRIDGTQSNNIMVEIKHRTGKILNVIPVHELIQVHAYMYIFGKTHIKLIQCVRTTTGTFSDTTILFFNKDFWAKIMACIAAVWDFIEELSTSFIAQECFFLLDSDQRTELMEKFFPDVPQVSEQEYQAFINPFV